MYIYIYIAKRGLICLIYKYIDCLKNANHTSQDKCIESIYQAQKEKENSTFVIQNKC